MSSKPNQIPPVLNNMKRMDIPYIVRRKRNVNNLVVSKMVEITCQENFNQYLMNTTLHGLRYVGDRSITLFERCFFGVMFLLVFLFSVYFITNVWIKWSASPMIITLSALSTPITEFPFPSVTICNMNQAQKSAVRNIKYGTVEAALVQSLCTQQVDDNITDSKSGKWSEFKKVLMKVSQPCEDMLVSCKYGGLDYDCMDIFSSILTDDGLCCIFNGLSQKYTMKEEYSKLQEFVTETIKHEENDWSPERGYSHSELKYNRNGSPRPAAGTGNLLGLTLVLNVAEAEYYCSSTYSYGFKVLMHSPNELPKIAYYGTAVANGFETRIVVVPTISVASYSVRRVPIKIRQCLFESENSLQFYKTYSRRNCETECETKIYFDHCNCVLYYMPRLNEDITICGRSDTICVTEVTRQLRAKTNASFVCECLPGCFAISFDTEYSLTPLLLRSPLLSTKTMTARNSAVLHVYYKDNSFRSQRKEELVGFTEFLSNTGGLLGLFMGFSVISISELFYFMTIRPYCNYVRRLNKPRDTIIGIHQKIWNICFRKKTIAASKITTKNVNSTVFPYVE